MKQNRRSFLRNSALVSGAITLRGATGNTHVRGSFAFLAGDTNSQSVFSADIRRQFQSPEKKYRPMARWWWPGNDVAESELRREIDVLDKAGFGGAEIQSFIKGFDPQRYPEARRQRVFGYATDSFFRNVAVVAEEARNRGMFIDYTFGSGWPFGGGEAITPELASVELRSSHISIEGPAKLSRKLGIPSVTDGDPLHGGDILSGLPSGWVERMKKRTRLVAVIAARGENVQWYLNQGGGRGQTVSRTGQLERGTSVDLSSHLQPDGTLHWDVPPGTWQVFVFCSVPTAQRVNGAAGEGPQLVLDHMNAEAFAAHAKRVGDAAIPTLGRFFGNGLRAVFCDSLEVRANLFWCDDFLTEFRRRRGYDLLLYLPIVQVQTLSEPYGEYVDLPSFDMEGIGDRVRQDYRQTVSDLMIERFYEQFNKWARDHQLVSRTQAHGAPVDVLRAYGEADIPETETLYDRGCYDFLKMAASAAHVYGRPIVGSESFVWSNALYQITPETMKRAADELLTAGVNAIVYHGFPTVVPDVPAPGWHPFTGVLSGCYSGQFNEANTYWPYLAQLNAYITRLQYISQAGRNIAAISLYRNDLLHGADETPPTPKLNQALLDAGYNYDHMNAESLLCCTVRNRKLITSGGAAYRALVLPAMESIEAAAAEALQGFASAGLPVLFAGRAPSRADGLSEGARSTERVQAAMSRMRGFQNACVPPDIEGLLAMLGKVADPNIRFHSKPLSFIQKKIGNIDAFFLRNDADTLQHLDAEFETQGMPELWDPWTGQAAGVASYRREGDWVRIELELQPYSSTLIVFDRDTAGSSANAVSGSRTLKRTEEIGAGGWRLTATGLDPSGKTVTIRRDLPYLIDWSLDSELRGFSGRGIYATTFTAPIAGTSMRFLINLGTVRDVAEVIVNGKPAATLLLRPYQTDVTELVRPGRNQLEIAVTNTLFNSMALRNPRPFHAGATENPSGLMSGGLIGPVVMNVME